MNKSDRRDARTRTWAVWVVCNIIMHSCGRTLSVNLIPLAINIVGWRVYEPSAVLCFVYDLQMWLVVIGSAADHYVVAKGRGNLSNCMSKILEK